jgi:NAD(P)-dependent dehydrogenase (short-subunit alcohol dehydrogenase family)
MQRSEGNRLKGKTALVTGSGRNIGRAIILKLAEEGANVVVNARSNQEEADSVAAEARELGVEALPFIADVSDHQQVTNMFAAAAEQFGGVDILVSNAAIRPHEPFTDVTLDEWQRVRGVVLDGAFHVAHAAIPNMVKNEYGRVVFFTGDGAFKGTAQRSHVSAAKMGVIGLARGLASEFAPKNIRVNVISPGRIDTTRDLSWYPQGGMRDTADIPVGRLGSVDDIASAALFLITDECGFMTGQTLHINGGTDFF